MLSFESCVYVPHLNELAPFPNFLLMSNSRLSQNASYCYVCRYLKGDRLFKGNTATVAATGLGTVGSPGGSTPVLAAEEGKLEVGVGAVLEDGAVKPAPPTLRARIVGQGYKQAR